MQSLYSTVRGVIKRVYRSTRPPRIYVHKGPVSVSRVDQQAQVASQVCGMIPSARTEGMLTVEYDDGIVSCTRYKGELTAKLDGFSLVASSEE